jgi:DNA repair protein RadC
MKPTVPKEYKVTALRECPVPEALLLCDTPEKAVEYWRLHIATERSFDPERECLAVPLLNTRRRVKGHQLLTIGTLESLLVDPRAVFRGPVIASAAAIVLLHNHPSVFMPHASGICPRNALFEELDAV